MLSQVDRDRRAIARIAAQAQARHDLLQLACDPLWSTVFGFILVHEARRADLLGPIADDILYTGIVAINTARSGMIKQVSSGYAEILGALGSSLSQVAQAAGSAGALVV